MTRLEHISILLEQYDNPNMFLYGNGKYYVLKGEDLGAGGGRSRIEKDKLYSLFLADKLWLGIISPTYFAAPDGCSLQTKDNQYIGWFPLCK